MLLAERVQTTLLARSTDEALRLSEQRHIPRMNEAIVVPATTTVSFDPESALSGCDAVILAVPSQTMRSNVRPIASLLRQAPIVMSAAKGLETETCMRMSQIISQELGDDGNAAVAVLTGPNLAPEIARGLPAMSVVASESVLIAESARTLLMTDRFHVYSQSDVVGVEMGGALKNIIALGAGICDGSAYGENIKAAFVTRGLAEITRLGVAAGANPLTFSGLAGLGDLWATCNSRFSRNRQFGEALAQGVPVEQALAQSRHVIEGVPTTKAARILAGRLHVEMPIVEQAYRVLFEDLDVATALSELMIRDAKHELAGLIPEPI